MSEAGTGNAMFAAAEAGDDKAQCELAMMYEHGIGCAKDYPTAAKWYSAAADKGNGFAAYKLALMYENGLLGSGPDPQNAMAWLERAANAGLGEAQHKLGVILETGKGGMENPKDGAKWLQMAADQGVADAQWRLGVLYENGRGVKQDFEKAAKLYSAASAQNNVNAHYALGVLYVTGDGVPVNPGEALRLLTMAAEMGHTGAKRRLNAAKIGAAPEAEAEPEPFSRKKKTGDAKPPIEESPQEFWTKSVIQALGLSAILCVLVLTPIGEFLMSITQLIGPGLAIVALVGAVLALLGMAVLFKMPKKKSGEDTWYKVVCVLLVILGAGAIIYVVGFTKWHLYNPEEHLNDVPKTDNARIQQLMEHAQEKAK